jgi:gamma-glutamyltranspeptidase/glutathione hydrolase
MSTRAFRIAPTADVPIMARVLGVNAAVAAEHHASAYAARDILLGGGNAVDACCAAVLVEGVVNQQMHSMGGEALFLISQDGAPPIAINGNTISPASATVDTFRQRGHTTMPSEGVMAAGAPTALSAVITALKHFGSMTFEEVSEAASFLARRGFAAHVGLIRQENFGIADLEQKFTNEWRASAAIYLPLGRVPQPGELIVNSALADLLDYLAASERVASGSREKKLDTVWSNFYRGDPARAIAAFVEARDGLLDMDDLAEVTTPIEQPKSYRWHFQRGGEQCHSDLYKCDAWCQGPATLATLAILDGLGGAERLSRLGHNSPEYLHLLLEATKLAYADREQWYGDTRFNRISSSLWSRSYGTLRSSLINDVANGDFLPGDPSRALRSLPLEERFSIEPWGAGTTHVDVADRDRMLVACTASGGWIKSNEVISGLGFALTTRLQTMCLAPSGHPNVLAGRKRPRTTISPSMAFFGGKPWFAHGSMGGDQQEQWQLQVFLNATVFGMSMQAAIEAARCSSEHAPGFFAPHSFLVNRVRIEERISRVTRAELVARGHDVDACPDWTEGFVVSAGLDPSTGAVEAACDPRGAKSEIFMPVALAW